MHAQLISPNTAYTGALLADLLRQLYWHYTCKRFTARQLLLLRQLLASYWRSKQIVNT